MLAMTYTVHQQPGTPDRTYTVTNPVLMHTLQDLLADAGHPPLPAYLPSAHITVQRLVQEGTSVAHAAPPRVA